MSVRLRVCFVMCSLLALAACSDTESPVVSDVGGAADSTEVGDVLADSPLGDASDGGPEGDVDPHPEGTLSGVAAIGAPIASATLTIKCSDGTSSTTATSTATGTFTADIAAGSGPCALRVDVDGGSLFSFSESGNGTANISPLTDLVLSQALDGLGLGTAASWFDSPVDGTTVAGALSAAQSSLSASLRAAGFTLPTGDPEFDPFEMEFSAEPGDPWDNLLEDIADAIEGDESVADYAAFRSLFVAGAALPDAPETARALRMTGDGAALGGKSGVTMTLGTKRYAFIENETRSNVSFFELGVAQVLFTIEAYGDDGSGGLEPLHFLKIGGVPSAVGQYDCRSNNDSLPLVRLGDGGYGADAASCVIEVLEVTNVSVKGRFSGVFDSIAVTDGYFEMIADTGGGEALPAGEAGVSFVVEGETYRYTLTESLAFDTFNGLSAKPESRENPGFPVGVQLHTIPDAVGTYACDEAFEGNEWRKVNVWFYWHGAFHYAGTRQNPSPGAEGSSCTIEVTAAGSPFEGNFSGTFVGDTDTIVVTDGLFRYYAE